MKKSLLWIIVMVLSISMVAAFSLYGCKVEEEAAVEEAAVEEAAVEEVAEEVAEPVVLTFYLVAANETAFDAEQRERFKAANPNILINTIWVAEGAGLDGFVLYAAGNNPEMWGAGLPQLAAYINAGVPMCLDDYVANWEDLQYIKTDLLDMQRVNGKLYAIPTDMYVMTLAYNKKIFAEAGLEPPTTWDELVSTAVALTDPSKNQWGYQLIPCWEEWHFEFFVWMAGGNLTKMNDDGTLALTFDDPAVKTAMEFYRTLIAADCLQPDWTQDYNEWQKNFAMGNAAMSLGGGGARAVEWGMDPEDIGYAALPVGPSGQKVGQLGGGAVFIFNNVSKEKADASWKWISFLQSKEELEAKMIDNASKGVRDPRILIRTDIDASLGEANPEDQALVNSIAEYAQFEFYGKGVVGWYVAQAVNKLEHDPNADIEEAFAEAAVQAQADVDKFNEGVLAAKAAE